MLLGSKKHLSIFQEISPELGTSRCNLREAERKIMAIKKPHHYLSRHRILQFISFKIRRTTFLNYTTFAHSLILRLFNCEMFGRAVLCNGWHAELLMG